MRALPAFRRIFAGFGAVGRDRRGTAALEMGLVAPALFMFLLGIAQFGYAFWLQNALDYAVSVAARCASVNTTTCSNSTTTASYAANASGADFAASVFQLYPAETTNCGGKAGNKVTGSYPVSLMIPFVDISLTLTSEACYPT